MIDASTMAILLGDAAPSKPELAALVAAVGQKTAPAIRVNRHGPQVRPDQTRFCLERVPWYPGEAYWVMDEESPARSVLFGGAAYYVQDAGSLLPVALLAPRRGELICDVCASPGGKATDILDSIGDDGAVLVNETVKSRLAPLRLNLAKYGATRWVGTNLDPTKLAEVAPGQFDAVLVDAPCTGQAVIGSGKQTSRAFDPAMVKHSAARQQRILDAAAELVRPGGRLVYSTCTFSWAENEQQVIDLCRRRGDFKLSPSNDLSQWRSPALDGCYRLYPHRHRSQGAFAARLARDGPESDGGHDPATGRPVHWRPPGIIDPAWGRWSGCVTQREIGGVLVAWPEGLPVWMTKVAQFGPEAAFQKGRTWFPAFGLAMRRDESFAPAATVELDEDQAKRFLRGEPVPSEARGWAVVAYRCLPLGWGKGNGRVLSNHLPKAARLKI
jgi:16S rRNA C967 or C1407 C5-methylase (RsmB/RsmF family)